MFLSALFFWGCYVFVVLRSVFHTPTSTHSMTSPLGHGVVVEQVVPPPQNLKPVPTKSIPMRAMTAPTMKRGKILWSIFGGMNDAIMGTGDSTMTQPRKPPYASSNVAPACV